MPDAERKSVAARDPDGAPALVKDLAEAYSIQSRISNRILLTLILVSIVIIQPSADAMREDIERTIPFIGSIDPSMFDLFAFLLLSILSLSFVGAYYQSVIVYRTAHDVIDKYEKLNPVYDAVSPREFFDMLILPSFTRASPFANVVLSFVRGSFGNKTGAVLYFLLKLVALIIVLVFPVYVVWFSYMRAIDKSHLSENTYVSNAYLFCLTVVLLVLTLSCILVLLTELKMGHKVFMLYWSGVIRERLVNRNLTRT